MVGMGQQNIHFSSDQYGIPTLEIVATMPRAASRTGKEPESHLEKVLNLRLSETAFSAEESMASEHASYGSTRFHLKTWLPINGPNHFAGIGHEAAVAAIGVNSKGKSIGLAYSSESHNGPSFVCPHPGAATGTGGDERDKIAKTGTKPDTILEARRQCDPQNNPHHDPVKQHTDETTKGIADYGNAMGIPHQDGSIKYHKNFSGNNLVNVSGISIVEKERLLSNKVPTLDDPSKYVGIYIGKASDTTGIGGTKFASVAIDMTNTGLNEKAVQDPDPHLQEADTRGLELLVNTALAEGWLNKISFKDMGAAGLLCSTLEQLHGKIGVVINGDLVPQNEPRTAKELLEAETQERFFIYVHEDYAQRVLDIFNKEIGLPFINKGARAAIIGRCNNTGKYTFVRDGIVELDIDAEKLAAGPLLYRQLKEPKSKAQPLPSSLTDENLQKHIAAVLESINFKSDAYVHNHYDKHVRSTNIVNRGEACATLRTHELLDNKIGYSMVFDSNCVYGLLDPKFQAEDSLVRAAWKMAAVGSSVIGVTNNANYGRTTLPEEMWEFVKGQEGIAKACYNWILADDYLDVIRQDPEIAEKLEQDPRRHITVNSGNCSLNKANANTGTAIPPTTILGVVGWTNTPNKYATWDLKPENSGLYLIGDRQTALGATDLLQSQYGPDCIGDKLFDIHYETNQKQVNAIIDAVKKGYVSAANTIEEGGLCSAVAKMVANTEIPVMVKIDLEAKMGEDTLSYNQKLFSENYGMVMQVTHDNSRKFLQLMSDHGISVHKIGSSAQGGGQLLFGNFAQYRQEHIADLYNNKIERKLAVPV